VSGRNYIIRSLNYFTPPQYCSVEQIENEMGGACSIYWGSGEVYTGFGGDS
jgi:hypothetical protein